jgi:tetratricopeptide (TPR) repeat protein
MLLFCGTLVLGLIGSRGAYLAIIAGAGLIVILLRHCRIELASWRYSLVFSGCGLITSLLITGLDLGRGLGRLGTLHNPWSAGADRFLIWQSSWEMFRDAPWHGLGVGIYGLAYPEYRLFGDKSAGHFAHNDLLQIGIETGILGVLSAVLICVFFADLVRRGLQNTTLSQRDKSEIIILAGGLLAVFFHSMFTFNLYIYSTLLVIGIVIARLYYLLPPSAGKVIRVDLNKFGKILRYAPPLACLIPLLFISSSLWSQIDTQKAFSALKYDRNEQAVRYLENAKRLWLSNDFNWYMEGEIVRLGLQNDRQLNQEQRADLFPLARESFEEAIRLNPLRAMSPHKLGLLLDNENNKAGKQSLERIMGLYRQALKIDPRYFPARVDLARLYARHGQNDKAEELLEAGLPYYYRDIPDMMPYLQLAGQYRYQKGDTKGFNALQQRIEDIKIKWQDKG